MVIILFALTVAIPIILILMDFKFYRRKIKKPIFEGISFLTGYLYMILCWRIWDPIPYYLPINVYGLESAHEPVNPEHFPTLLVIVIIGFISYFILKFKRTKITPLGKVLCMAGIYGSLFLHLIFLIQILPGTTHPEAYNQVPTWWDNGIYIICLSTVPILFFLHVQNLFHELVKEEVGIQQEIVYQNKILAGLNGFLCKSKNIFWVAIPIMIPFYGIVIAVLCIFGQKPDSALEAFTQTSEWLLSTEVSPPPIAYDTHYLCTVSLRGHRKLVKPVRYGVRRGERIIVNRQLCIANAFEQLLEERIPTIHSLIRNFYDRYGYPVSKWITNPWSADIVYILMKPLEWFFLLILYLFDEKPENRIGRQYLPMESVQRF